MTLLQELCRRNGWHRPNYLCHAAKGGGGGFTCKVWFKETSGERAFLSHIPSPLPAGFNSQIILSREDAKTKEKKTIFTNDRRVYVDEQTAKHFASVYAMHQVAFDKASGGGGGGGG